MIAIDTNVLVRLLTGDDPAQYKASLKLFSTEQIFIPDSVVLETEWVLRAAYDQGPSEVCNTFKNVFGLANVSIANNQVVTQAINWHEAGLDFSDAFHLAQSQGQECLKTFDAEFIKRAAKLTEFRVEKP